jgi:hypothetical protein
MIARRHRSASTQKGSTPKICGPGRPKARVVR